MAIIYTINDQEFEIGSGFASQGQAESPAIINPFPKYSIQRELLLSEDGSYLGNKYSITVNGQLIVPASADMTVSGERQNALHKQLIWHLQTLSGNPKYHNLGKLEIVPYGGGNKPFIFLDARLMSIDIPEQSDESSGVLYSDYTFNFEAYKEVSDNNENLCLGISSVEESWDLTIEDAASYYTDPNGSPYKTYTITHTVNATGYKSISDDEQEITLAWKKAADFVKTRLASKPPAEVVSDIANLSDKIVKTFYPKLFGYTDDSGIFAPNLDTNNYGFYNHIRVPQCNFSAGSYSVTETWTASKMKATLEMDIELATDENELTTAVLSGTITGLDESTVNSVIINKLDNAENVLATIESNAYAIVSQYGPSVPNNIKDVIRSKTIGRNKATGVITFNYTYNNNDIIVPNSISSSISVQDDNEIADIQVIAILPIINKPEGPIIQNMGTTPEKKRTVQIEAVMKRTHRSQKPNVLSIANQYKPSGSNVYVQAHSETWEKNSGSYNFNIEWVYV